MMWEVYVAVLQKDGKTCSPALTFDQVRRKMADYVVAGHQMTPRDATPTPRPATSSSRWCRPATRARFTVIAEAFEAPRPGHLRRLAAAQPAGP